MMHNSFFSYFTLLASKQTTSPILNQSSVGP